MPHVRVGLLRHPRKLLQYILLVDVLVGQVLLAFQPAGVVHPEILRHQKVVRILEISLVEGTGEATGVANTHDFVDLFVWYALELLVCLQLLALGLQELAKGEELLLEDIDLVVLLAQPLFVQVDDLLF